MSRAKLGLAFTIGLLSGAFLGRFIHIAGRPPQPCVAYIARVAVLEQQARRAETVRQIERAECEVGMQEAVVGERIRLTGKTNPEPMIQKREVKP
jgi:hypothetical protein